MGLSVQNSETAIKIMMIIMIRMSANSSEAQGLPPSSHSYWKINVLAAIELMPACFFKDSRRGNL